jgi:hypothetical protein
MESMQNAKDTFYIALRNRLASLNPARAMLWRGVQRPGIMVEEAEAVVAQMAPDIFVLRWTGLKVDMSLPRTLAQLDCEIHYTTGGTQSNGGLDRGRALEAMDAELVSLLNPPSAAKMDYTQTPATALNSNVFWTLPLFGPETTIRERLDRLVKVSVFTYLDQEER